MIAALMLAAALPRAVEAEFPAGAPSGVAVAVASICIDQGWSIMTQTDNQVVCERTPDPLSRLSYITEKSRRGASALRGFVRFIVLPQPGRVRVQVSGYSEYSTAFGQMRVIPLEMFGDIEPLIVKAGGTIATAKP